jgi:hypothetical protein
MKIVKQFLKIDEICSNVRNFMNLYEIGLRIVLDSMEFRRQLDSQPFFFRHPFGKGFYPAEGRKIQRCTVNQLTHGK